MYPLARSPVREARLECQAAQRAFTLIELLTVITIIAILAAISVGVIRGVKERAAIGQAKTELAVLAQALEAYKMQYGDYPWTTDSAIFYGSLMGHFGPQGAPLGNSKRLIEPSKFRVADTSGADASNLDATGNYLVDPWGRPYRYYYKVSPGTAWKAPSYVLYSCGPTVAVSGDEEPTNAQPNTVGVVVYDNDSNRDNIYANRN